MGQKVNPHGIRVGVIKDWDSRWFASKKDFSDNLVEDHKIRTELKAQLKDAGVPKIEIERTVDPSTSAPRVTVNIYCAKPGMVIGKGGEERVALQNKLSKEYGKTDNDREQREVIAFWLTFQYIPTDFADEEDALANGILLLAVL